MIDGFLPRGLDLSDGLGFTALLKSSGHESPIPIGNEAPFELSDATTVLAARFAGGVVMIGDRQATEGYSVAHRRIDKVFAADRFSAVAISGTAGLALEMVRLFQTELEHYEKLESMRLSLDGKATYLARLIRQQLPMAFQGLVVIPIFGGYDEMEKRGRLFTFDAVGGRYEEHDFGATGSGSREARSYLRNRYQPDLDEDGALQLAMEALVAAAEQDVATGGPDLRRDIYPTVVKVSEVGFEQLGQDVVRGLSEHALENVR